MQLLGAALVLAVATTSAVPVPDWINTHVIGGSNAKSDRLYQISLVKDGVHFCGGAAVSDNHVVTAAHCLYREDLKRFRVRAGSLSNKNGQVYTLDIPSVSIMKCYNDKTHDCDIAVFKVKEKFSKNVIRVKLADKEPADESFLTVTGWGLTSGSSSTLPDNLQLALVRKIQRSRCSAQYDAINKITTNMICAGDERKNICKVRHELPTSSPSQPIRGTPWCAPPESIASTSSWADSRPNSAPLEAPSTSDEADSPGMDNPLPVIPAGERPPRIDPAVYATWSKAKKNRWARQCRTAHRLANERQAAGTICAAQPQNPIDGERQSGSRPEEEPRQQAQESPQPYSPPFVAGAGREFQPYMPSEIPSEDQATASPAMVDPAPEGRSEEATVRPTDNPEPEGRPQRNRRPSTRLEGDPATPPDLRARLRDLFGESPDTDEDILGAASDLDLVPLSPETEERLLQSPA